MSRNLPNPQSPACRGSEAPVLSAKEPNAVWPGRSQHLINTEALARWCKAWLLIVKPFQRFRTPRPQSLAQETVETVSSPSGAALVHRAKAAVLMRPPGCGSLETVSGGFQ